jgi:hypothetical protein
MVVNTTTKFEDIEFKELIYSNGVYANNYKSWKHSERDHLNQYVVKYKQSKGKDKSKKNLFSNCKPYTKIKGENKGGNSELKNCTNKDAEQKSVPSKNRNNIILSSRRRFILIRIRCLRTFLSQLGMIGTKSIPINIILSKVIGNTIIDNKSVLLGFKINKRKRKPIVSHMRPSY